jgi:hypothetical protein
MARTPEDETARATRRGREDERMASIPATYVDGYTVSWWSEGMRIAFAEYLNGERYYRLAVMMSLGDAEDLAKTLLTSVEKARAQLRSRDLG